MNRSLVAGLVIAAIGTATLWWGTDGFRALTAEAARRAEVLRAPRLMPTVSLQDQDGRSFRLEDYRDRLLAVEFIYVNCPTLCNTLGQSFQQVRNNLPATALGQNVVLLSISFDPKRDTPQRLKDFAHRHGADGNEWRIARIEDEQGLKEILETFGIVVIPDRFGGYEHNAALHLVDGQGRLSLIEDYDQPQRFAAAIKSRL